MSRKIIAGIDEAGLGPKLGPLVISLCSFEDYNNKSNNPLDSLMGVALSKKADLQSDQVSVDDSKVLHQGKKGFAQIEKTALSFWAALNGRLPKNMGDWLLDTHLNLEECPWYGKTPHKAKLPLTVSKDLIKRCQKRIQQALKNQGLGFYLFKQDVVSAPELNRRIRKYGNKSATLAISVMTLVSKTATHSQDEISFNIAVDKLGGRAFYSDMLQSIFPFKSIKILEEGPARSIYKTNDIEIGFYRSGDALFSHVALASIFSKYVRECFMRLFNDYWTRIEKGLKPTAGYPVDAKRFIEEVKPLALKQGLDPEAYIRIR